LGASGTHAAQRTRGQFLIRVKFAAWGILGGMAEREIQERAVVVVWEAVEASLDDQEWST
jgi:hypothetical protein